MSRATNKPRFVHTNLVAADWRRLATFYEAVFGCEVIPPERDLSGDVVERGTGIRGARIRGAHLRLPGYGPDGPTLEVFQYRPAMEHLAPATNLPGFAHIAFAVNDVEQMRDVVTQAGGGAVGDVVTTKVDETRSITWCYVTDPEGNIVELQSSRP